MVTKDMVDEEPCATCGAGAVCPPLQGDSLDSPLEFWGCHIAGGGVHLGAVPTALVFWRQCSGDRGWRAWG